MALDDARIQGFLASKEVAVLATVQADGAPLAMPMWFLHEPSSVTMISVADTQKVRNLRRDPRASVVAEAVAGSGEVRGVTLQGRADHPVQPWAAHWSNASATPRIAIWPFIIELPPSPLPRQ